MVDKEKILNALDDFKDDYGTSFHLVIWKKQVLLKMPLICIMKSLRKIII